VFARSRDEALAAFEAARAKGHRLIDLGCMQVNHHYHAHAFASVADMLDPVQNVRYAARFLRKLYAETGTWTLAVARYHASPANTTAQSRYICRVTRNLIAHGFGQWTPEAKRFCERAPA
jgi:soluble lytic murein transglycosylase-like protein